MSQTLHLRIDDAGADDAERDQLARRLQAFINDYARDCEARPLTRALAPVAGAKAGALEATVLGSLVVLFFQTGGFKQLVDCLNGFLQGNRSTVKVTLTGEDGTTVTIDSKVKNDELEQFVDRFTTRKG